MNGTYEQRQQHPSMKKLQLLAYLLVLFLTKHTFLSYHLTCLLGAQKLALRLPRIRILLVLHHSPTRLF